MLASRSTLLPLALLVMPCTIALADEGSLTVTGTVVMPGGGPAPGAIVATVEPRSASPKSVKADESGRFRLQGVFEDGIFLEARTEDGEHRAALAIPPVAARTAAASPIELKLAPALTRDVMVIAGGNPAEGAQVMVRGQLVDSRGVTGPDGKARLRFPAGGQISELVAWHPTLGVCGLDLRNAPFPDGEAKLELIPPAPLKVRAIDEDGKPIPGLELGLNVAIGDWSWISTGKIEGGHARTDRDGTITVPWAPREGLVNASPDLFDPGWKIDTVDNARIAERVVEVRGRRKVAVEGRLVVPAGVDPAGLLIKGFGFGPDLPGDQSFGDAAGTRARADGSFALRVAPDHGYVLGIVDLRWACDPWSGVISEGPGRKPVDLAMTASPATPVSVRVTRGRQGAPVADAWVHVERRAEVEWVEASGKKRSGGTSIGSWLLTDGDGMARAGVGRGKFKVRMWRAPWVEERTMVAASDEPIQIEFHRPWLGDRKVVGKLMDGGKRYEPSLKAEAWAWDPQGAELKPEIAPDGTFQVSFDESSLVLLVSDPAARRSGFARLGPEDTTIDLEMVPMATYRGTALDQSGQPVAGRALDLRVKGEGGGAFATGRTDEAGRFQFEAVPADVPLSLNIVNGVGQSHYYLDDPSLMFLPGEVREGAKATAQKAGSPARPSRPLPPLAERINAHCRDARLGGMRTLVVLGGDESKETTALIDRLLDEDRFKALNRYIIVRIKQGELGTEAATLREFGWPAPGPGKVTLVVLGGDREAIATEEIEAARSEAALEAAGAFLERHKSPTRDAKARLAAAKAEAKETGRRVWIVEGGPRCGPCIGLGRWIDDHHAALEKDYVILKVMHEIDEHAEEVMGQLPREDRDGIPWHAIVEPDGTVLATSRSPLGNISFPHSLESRRHFRQMLDRTARKLTAEEIGALVDSLAEKR